MGAHPDDLELTVPEDPFEQRSSEYDAWYDRHEAAYRSELEAVRSVLGPVGRALEVGVGTGRFAAPLGVRFGVDPAAAMVREARERGVTVARAVGEHLPFRDRCFDRVLIALTLCFVDVPVQAFREARRVLVPEGGASVRTCRNARDPGHTPPMGRVQYGVRFERSLHRNERESHRGHHDRRCRDSGQR